MLLSRTDPKQGGGPNTPELFGKSRFKTFWNQGFTWQLKGITNEHSAVALQLFQAQLY